jgi:Ca-activated chloride channel family protein
MIASFSRTAVVCALALLPGLAGTGCKEKDNSKGGSTDPTGATAVTATAKPVPAGAVRLTLAYSSEKKSWLEDQAKRFEASGAKTASGKKISVDLKALGSGEAVQGIKDGSLKPHVFSPASSAYVKILNDEWLSTAGRTKPIATQPGDTLVLSPVVIGMWKPMAEALGWPGKPISWTDFLKVSTDPKGWGSKGFPEWGKFKYGHCHPEFSNSGFLAVLAEAYAGAKKTRDLTVADLDAKPTVDFLTQVESTIVFYGKSTGFFADKMVTRGPKFLSAAVLYENLVIESYSKSAPMPLVAVYPVEGTFWADHPYTILDAPWVGADEKQAAEAFLAFLKERPAQDAALALGFRPGDPKIAVGAPVDAAHGVDPKQPQTILPLPDGKVLSRLIPIWQKTKKGADVVFVFDKSGSMDGKPLAEAKKGAKAFFEHLDDRDDVTVVFFDNTVYPPTGPLKLANGRGQLSSRVDGTMAGGGTALYDAIAAGYDLASTSAQKNPNQIHAVVVMTDGKDENSKMTLQQLKAKFPAEEATVKVFTIAYGQQAESRVLDEIAEAAKGSSAKGSLDTIKDVYLDMASFF